ncbi:MAG: tryptophan synthase subunit beta [Pseudomonas sp.]
MYYVKRDAAGLLCQVETRPFDDMHGEMSDEDPELQQWLTARKLADNLQRLESSDLEMIRVLDDLIAVLINKGVIRITDLPPAAHSKLMQRTHARQAVSNLSSLINDDEPGLI